MGERNQREVQVLKPITLTAIEWTSDEQNRLVPARAKLEYRLSYDGGAADPSFLKAWGLQGDRRIIIDEGGPVTLDVYAGSLSFRDEKILERFLCLGVHPGVAAKINELSDDPAQNDPIALENGTLAELLKSGIGPVEVWTFLLNHGAARSKNIAVSNPVKLDETKVRTYDPWPGPARKRKLLDNAILRCSQAASALRKLMSVDMAAALVTLGQVRSIQPENSRDSNSRIELRALPPAEAGAIGPLPALAPNATETMVNDLEGIANNLKRYLPVFSQPSNRPASTEATDFCRDWYELAVGRADTPLYEAGAALYSLVFSATIPSSFERRCRRARRTKVASTD